MGNPNRSFGRNTASICVGRQNEAVHRTLRIGLAQINATVGDLEGNTRLITDWIERARDQEVDLVCFPELALTGYPPEDLVLKPGFVRDNLKQLRVVAEATKGISAVVGFVDEDGAIFNAAAFIRDGVLKGVYHKVFLPNYGVFDEQRYFTIGHRCPIFEQSGIRIGVTICEDCWYPSGPMAWQAEHGVELLVNINGSPYHEGKRGPREEMVRGRAVDYGAYVAYVNTVGGQDELVFDGNSVIFDPRGEMVAHGKSFREDLVVYDIDVGGVPFHRPLEKIRHEAEGAARLELEVTEVSVATGRGIQLLDFPIEPAHRAFEQILAGAFEGTRPGVAEENLQPRIRSVILHALSNKFGYIVLTTGNKSEIATGYCTLYGDMAGGFAVLKDITKTTVYELCRYRNSLGPAIPERVLTQPPSAELKPGQKDSDSLPPYDELDPILRGYVEEDLTPDELIAAGNRAETVARVIQLVDRSEYKRRQAPPGVKITPRAFGRDRRMPITNRYVPNGVRPAH